jgi:hypothetical protein
MHFETPVHIPRFAGETEQQFIDRANSEISMDHIIFPTGDVNILTAVIPTEPPKSYNWHKFRLGDYRLFRGDDLTLLRNRVTASSGDYGRRYGVKFSVKISREHGVVGVQRVGGQALIDLDVGENMVVRIGPRDDAFAAANRWRKMAMRHAPMKFNQELDYSSRTLTLTRTA